MAGWRVDLEEKPDGQVTVHYDDAPDSSARAVAQLPSWQEALDFLEGAREQLRAAAGLGGKTPAKKTTGRASG